MQRVSSLSLTSILCALVGTASAQGDIRAGMAQNGATQTGPNVSLTASTTPAGPLLAWPGRTTAALGVEDSEDTADLPSEDDSEGASEPNDKSESSDDPPPDAPEKPGDSATPWLEKDNADYRFIGLRARLIYIPTFMFGLFHADGGKSVLAPSIGPEYVTRRDGFEVDTWLTFTSFPMDDAPFKSKSDPDVAYEIVNSELKALTIGADFLWTKPLNEKGLSLVYGGGAGIGVVFGDLQRNQSYPENNVPGDPADYKPCPRPGFGPGNYCDNDNDHYGDYTEPNWLDGGSKPLLFPWIALPQVGLRWKPSQKFVLRIDTGLSLPGPFFFGVSGQYGLL